jgi:hypothetical protein
MEWSPLTVFLPPGYNPGSATLCATKVGGSQTNIAVLRLGTCNNRSQILTQSVLCLSEQTGSASFHHSKNHIRPVHFFGSVPVISTFSCRNVCRLHKNAAAGNRLFRESIATFLSRYEQAPSRQQKSFIVRQVCKQYGRTPGGPCFVRKVRTTLSSFVYQ